MRRAVADIVELAPASGRRLAAGGGCLLEDEAPALQLDDPRWSPRAAAAARDAEIVMVFGGDGTLPARRGTRRYTDAAS